MLTRINALLDRYILPWPVRFLTFRFTILATLALLVPLLLFADNQVLVLSINSYLNTMSVAVSSIVLLYATIAEVRQRQIAELQERRAQEDHEHVTQMHRLVMETLANQHLEIHHLELVLAELQGKPYTPEHVPPVPDLQALHPLGAERFDDASSAERIDDKIHRSSLTDVVREHLAHDD